MPNNLPSVSSIPLNAPFFDDRGNLSRVWVDFLQGLAPQTPVPVVLVDGDNADVFIGSSNEIIVTGPAAAFSISGFTGGANGRRLHILNYSGQPMTLKNVATNTPIGDQILTLTGADVTLGAGNSSATFVYYNVSPVADGNPPGAWVLESSTPAASSGNSILKASGLLNPLTNAYQDIPGATVTLNQDGNWVLLITFDLHSTVNAGGAFGVCKYDGGFAQTPEVAGLTVVTGTNADNIEGSIPMTCFIEGNVGSKVAKLQAKKGAAAGTAFANTCQIKAIFLP